MRKDRAMVQRFLAALDGGKSSESILPYLETLLSSQDADITLVQAIPGTAGSEIPYAYAYLNQVAKRLRGRGAVVDVHVLTGNPAEALVDMAVRGGYSLILMCSKGRKGLGRIMFGSVTEEVLRRSPIPVFVVHPPTKTGEKPHFKRIVVPLDGSHRSGSILPHAAALAKATGSKLLFMTIVDPRAKDAPPVDVVAKYLFKEQKRLHKEGVQTELSIRYGDPASEIISYGDVQKADLLAMSTHGRSGIERTLYGSVAESVLRKGNLPMLVLRTSGKFVYDPTRAQRRRKLETSGSR